MAAAAAPSHDEGISLIEIVISMFMLALVAVAFLPLLANSVSLSSSSANLTSAAELADARMTLGRSNAASCSTIRGLPQTETDTGDGRILRTTSSAGACPTTFPGVVSFTATVTDLTSAKILTTAKTVIAVTG